MSFIFKNHKKIPYARISLENNLYIPIIQILDLYDTIKIIDIIKNILIIFIFLFFN
jgi:hypothetical protein